MGRTIAGAPGGPGGSRHDPGLPAKGASGEGPDLPGSPQIGPCPLVSCLGCCTPCAALGASRLLRRGNILCALQLLHQGAPKSGFSMRSELLQQTPASSVCAQAAEALRSVWAAAALTCSRSSDSSSGSSSGGSSSSSNSISTSSKHSNSSGETCGSAKRDAALATTAAAAAGAARSAAASDAAAAPACCFCAFLPLCPQCLGSLKGPSSDDLGAPRSCEICSTAPLPPVAEAARLSRLLLLPLRGPSSLSEPPPLKLRGPLPLRAETLREKTTPRGIRFARCLYTWGTQDSFLLGLPTFSCHGDSRERPPTRVPLRALAQQQQQQQEQQQEKKQEQQEHQQQGQQQQAKGGLRRNPSCMCISCGGPDCLQSECASVCGVFCGPGASAAATAGGGLWVWGPSAGGSTGVTVPPTPLVLEEEKGPPFGSGADRLTKTKATTRREGGLQGGLGASPRGPLQIVQVALGLRHGLALVKRGAPHPTETLLYAWGPDPLLGGPAAAAGTGSAGLSGDAAAASRDPRKGPLSGVTGGPQLICQSSCGPVAQGLVRGPLITQLEKLEWSPPRMPSRKETGPPPAGTLLPGPKGPLRLSVSAIAAGDRHALLLLDEGVVMVYGSNERGQCAQPASVSFVTRPQSLDLPVIKQVAAAAAASAAFGVGPQQVFCWGASPVVAAPTSQQQQQQQQQLKQQQGQQQRFVKHHPASRNGDSSNSDNNSSSSSSSKTLELFYKPLPVRFCRSPGPSGRGAQGAPGDWQEQPMGHGAPPLKWIAVSDFAGAALTSNGELCVWLSAVRPAEMCLLTSAAEGPPGSPPETRGPPLPFFESVSFGGPHQLLGRTAEGLLYSIHIKEADAAAAGAAVIAGTPQLLPLAGVTAAAASSRHGAAAVSMPLPRFPVPFTCANQQQQQQRKQQQQQQQSQRHQQQQQEDEQQQQLECPSLLSLCCSSLASRCAAVADLLQLSALCDRLVLPELFDFCCCALLLNLPLFLQQQQQQQRLQLSRAASAGMQLLLLQVAAVGALRPLDCQSIHFPPEVSLEVPSGSGFDSGGGPPASTAADEEGLVSVSPERRGAPEDGEGPLPRLFSAVSATPHAVFIGPTGGPPEKWLAAFASESECLGAGAPGGKATKEGAPEPKALEGHKQVQHQALQQDKQQHQQMQQKQQHQKQQQPKQHPKEQQKQQQRPQPRLPKQQQQQQQPESILSGRQDGVPVANQTPQTSRVWGPPPACSAISEPLQQQLHQSKRQQQPLQEQQQKQQQQEDQHQRQQHEEQHQPQPQWQSAGRGPRGPPSPALKTTRSSSLGAPGGPLLRGSGSPFLQPTSVSPLLKASVQGGPSQGPATATRGAPMKVALGSLIRVRPSKKALSLRAAGDPEGPPADKEAGAPPGSKEAPIAARRAWGPPKEVQAAPQVSMREVMEEQLQEQPREGPLKGLHIPGSVSRGQTRGAFCKGRGGPGHDPSCNRWGPQAAAKVQGSGTQGPSLAEIAMEEKETERALLLVAESLWFEELVKGQAPRLEGYSPPPGAWEAPPELLGASSEPVGRATQGSSAQGDRGGHRRRPPPQTQEQRARGGCAQPRGPRRTGGFRRGAPRGRGPSSSYDT